MAVLTLGSACSAGPAEEPGTDASATESSASASASASDSGSGSPEGTATASASADSSPGDSASGEASPSEREPEDGEPGEPDKQGRQSDVFDRVPGSADPSCVNVGDGRDVRSGGFVAGAFDDAVAGFEPGDEIPLYFVPLHGGTLQKLDLRLSGPGGASGQVTRVVKGSTSDWRYYDTTLTLPRAGRWTLRVTAGPDRGCFRVTFRA